ncbi:CTB family bacteriocin [Chlorogloeopsis fritschii PCC 9212]|jgi:hypothetical protein|uniref:Uncharacterized protein n=1 Tax=Chlorogloeopsis fritschii PCC 6912 TaxID=211165 RepID=A0A433NDQ3_CHLFR|nr:CTB family bacteriocin [Chlorogloeopsis fritschii]MBF2004438.1 CTB family bacteriocin [Chlorogloeopsis fritschii C42_A2020_084]RUR80231.1 hypothetical protein PCC6912_30910 [Chlorogloeopsis fritschii PCC 6912]
MSNQDFATELFADVTEEQQQMVAGGSYYGYYYPKISESLYANFSSNFKVTDIAATVVAGPGGSYATKKLTAIDESVYSNASEYLAIYG